MPLLFGLRCSVLMLIRIALLASLIFSAALVNSAELPERWVYIATNHLSDEAVTGLEAVMKRAAAAGYSGIQLNDSKFAKLDDLGDNEKHYFKNVERIKKLAAELKLELIPGLFSIGYSNDLLWFDPNLAEGLEVQDAPFVVKDGVAQIVPNSRGFGKPSFVDPTVKIADRVWSIVDPKGRNARIMFGDTKVEKHRQYHVSVKVRTQDFKGDPQITILGNGRGLAFAHLGIKSTQDWTEHHQVFNSQDCAEVGIYFGTWGGKTGTLEFKDAKFEELGLVNALRRDGCPLKVTRDTGEELVEGKDFDKFSDPLMGSKPYNGSYDVYHTPPPLKVHLPDGTKLKVSYYHSMTIYDGQVMICPSEPRTLELLKKQAELVSKTYGTKKYFMHFDEIRCLNQCALCRKRNLQPGVMLAELARKCTALMHDVAPGAQLYTWNDMFDPFHNAVKKDYYLVNGDLSGSWEGLDKSVVIVDWHYDKRDESMKFFSDRGHALMAAGYYDGSHDTRKWLESLKKIPSATGIMYTTWEHKFGELENFLKTAKDYYP